MTTACASLLCNQNNGVATILQKGRIVSDWCVSAELPFIRQRDSFLIHVLVLHVLNSFPRGGGSGGGMEDVHMMNMRRFRNTATRVTSFSKLAVECTVEMQLFL
mmetsp:Transcript_23051/g.41849  ORF Transcript_23051/g.41849 Transcript_23051/m.41849 type:complete len:104 (-) Transcript_23051:80-391(-)